MKKWLIGEVKGIVMFSVFLVVDMSVVSSSLRAGSGTAGSIGSQEDEFYPIIFLLLFCLY